jgi:hypothetical protein
MMNRGAGPITTETVESPPMMWLEFPDETRADAQTLPSVAPASERRAVLKRRDSSISMPSNPQVEGNPQNLDWAAAAERAAARISQDTPAPDVHTAPHTPIKPFAWDKAHTERWSPATGGGTTIRLGDHCEVTFLPLPVGGCLIGKIEPRGDLFEEMKRPVEFGDWKKGDAPGSIADVNGGLTAEHSLPQEQP